MFINRMRTRVITALLLAALVLAVSSAVLGFVRLSEAETAFAKENLIRLHVVAHSDLPEDQDLKLLVRDAVLQEAKTLFAEAASKEEAQKIILENQDRIISAAEQVIQAEGFAYPVSIEVGSYMFPTRSYGELTLPAGDYDAVRVCIGDAKGANWWCVLFPPLCLAEVDNEQEQNRLVRINPENPGGGIAFRLKVFEYAELAKYAQQLRNWWQASAAGLTRTEK